MAADVSKVVEEVKDVVFVKVVVEDASVSE